jgi:hypothetical protein
LCNVCTKSCLRELKKGIWLLAECYSVCSISIWIMLLFHYCCMAVYCWYVIWHGICFRLAWLVITVIWQHKKYWSKWLILIVTHHRSPRMSV